jgi:hypothetical protein
MGIAALNPSDELNCDDGIRDDVVGSSPLPVGQITDFLSSPFSKNISIPSRPKSPAYPVPSRLLIEGRFAIVTDVGGGMRWTRRCH